MKNEMTMSRAAFVTGAGAVACALAGCSGGLGGAGGAKAASTADAACVDDNANVTVYAAINLGGADLVRLLKHQNYEWQGESVGYSAVDDAGFFAFTFSKVSDDVDELADSAIPLSKSEYEELEPGGGDETSRFCSRWAAIRRASGRSSARLAMRRWCRRNARLTMPCIGWSKRLTATVT